MQYGYVAVALVCFAAGVVLTQLAWVHDRTNVALIAQMCEADLKVASAVLPPPLI